MRRWMFIVASLVVILALVQLAGFREVGRIWSAIAPWGIATSISCYVLALVVRVAAWKLLLRPEAPPALSLTPPLALGIVLGNVTPAKSGEPVTAVLVSRAFGLPLPRTLSVLTAERGAQLLTLLATFLLAAVVTAADLLELRGLVVGGAVAAVALLVGALLAPNAVTRLRPAVARIPRLGEAAASFLDGLADLLRQPRLMGPLLLFGLAFWLLQYMSLWAILSAGGASVNPIEATVVAGAAILGGTLSMLPLGTQDGISAAVLAAFDVPLRQGFALALFHSALSLAMGMGLAALTPWLMRKDPRG